MGYVDCHDFLYVFYLMTSIKPILCFQQPPLSLLQKKSILTGMGTIKCNRMVNFDENVNTIDYTTINDDQFEAFSEDLCFKPKSNVS